VSKYNIFICLMALSCLQACSKADSTTEVPGDKPVFYTVLNMANRRDSLVAGHRDYYMFSNYTSRGATTGRNEWLIFQGNLRRVSCGKTMSQSGSICDRNLLFEFFNTQPGEKPSEASLTVGARTFSRPNSLDSLLPAEPLVRLQWVDELNRTWDTECIQQPSDTYFLVDEAREYALNELNLPTRLFRVRFNCMVANRTLTANVPIVRCIGEGVIAVGYPRHRLTGGGGVSQ
jgi:hypothetical protein